MSFGIISKIYDNPHFFIILLYTLIILPIYMSNERHISKKKDYNKSFKF